MSNEATQGQVVKALLHLEQGVKERDERIAQLEEALRKCDDFLSEEIALMYQRHSDLVPEEGLAEEGLRDEIRAALSPSEPRKEE